MIQLRNGHICSASADKTIKFWNPANGENEGIIKAHDNCITCAIQLKDDNICTISKDKSIKIFNLTDK